MTITFSSGAHSETEFAEQHLTPHFAAGTITEYPGATHYAICYGELCAYNSDYDEYGNRVLLACWSAGVPDCPEDIEPNADYSGEWLPQELATTSSKPEGALPVLGAPVVRCATVLMRELSRRGDKLFVLCTGTTGKRTIH